MIAVGLQAHEALQLLVLHGCTHITDALGNVKPLDSVIVSNAARASSVFPGIAALRYAVTDDFSVILETDHLGELLCRGLRP